MDRSSDRNERREAMRLFIGVAVAALVLIVAGAVGGYFLIESISGWAASTFEPGLGLKGAAIIAFALSFVAVVVLTVVSGGDAILGELPFTLVGFFLFFLFCWLMLAWIF